MNLTEAIRIKRLNQHWLPKESYPELIVADNLAIEALKHIQALRKQAQPSCTHLLPGETEE